MRRPVCAGLTLAFATLASSASAEGESYDGKVFLDWSASASAERCLTREQLIADVEKSLGRSVFAPREDADRVLRVAVDAVHVKMGGEFPGRFTGQLVLLMAGGGSLGERDLAVESADCSDVTTAFALAVSIMADLPRTSAELAASQTRLVMPAPPRPVPVAPARWHAWVGIGALGALDTNGDVAPGAHASLVVLPTRFVPFAVDVVSELRSSSNPQGAGYTLLGTAIAPMICAPPWSRDRFAWLSCLGPDLKIYLGWGAGFTESHAGVSSTVGGMIQNYATYSISPRWRLVAGLAMEASPQRVSLAAFDRGGVSTTFYRTPVFTAVASIGVAAEVF